MDRLTRLWRRMKWQAMQVAVAVDQVGNALLGGFADETISSRSWRRAPFSRRWAVARAAIDAMFLALARQRDHCQQSFESERLRRHLPPELRPGPEFKQQLLREQTYNYTHLPPAAPVNNSRTVTEKVGSAALHKEAE